MADTTIIHPTSLSRQSLKGDPAHIFSTPTARQRRWAASGPLNDRGYGFPADWPAALWAAFAVAAGGQFLFWLSMGVEGPLEMGYQQAVTPDRLIARMSATKRSMNRGMIVLGAPLGGALATLTSSPIALWAAAGVMLLSALVLLFSKFRNANVENDQLTDEEALTH